MMNKAVLAMAALANLSLSANAQAADNGFCVDMEAICTTDTYNFPAVVGLPTTDEPNYYGCLGSQPNPTWWFLEIDNPGDITMSLTAASDIDYAVWGPFASVDQAIGQCNGGLTESNYVTCSYSPTNIETIQIDGTQNGEIYVLLITNYSNQPQDITLVKSGGAATTNCDDVIPCDDDTPAEGFVCTRDAFVNGVGTCGEGIKPGYYPDLTNKKAYCKCTGSAAPSRYEVCPNGLHWDVVTWHYIRGKDNDGVKLGRNGYWGTAGGVCNWPAAVSAKTRQRPPYTARRRKLECLEPTEAPAEPPTPPPSPSASFCVMGSFVNGVESCPEGIPDGYYPDLTNKSGYCKCTGTAAPSRYEKCPNGLHWDSVNWAYKPGTAPDGTPLGSGGYYGTIGGICNWPGSVSAQTQERPPWSRRLLRQRQ